MDAKTQRTVRQLWRQADRMAGSLVEAVQEASKTSLALAGARIALPRTPENRKRMRQAERQLKSAATALAQALAQAWWIRVECHDALEAAQRAEPETQRDQKESES